MIGDEILREVAKMEKLVLDDGTAEGEMFWEYQRAKLLWTDAEVEELSKQTGGIPTEELLRRLSELRDNHG